MPADDGEAGDLDRWFQEAIANLNRAEPAEQPEKETPPTKRMKLPLLPPDEPAPVEAAPVEAAPVEAVPVEAAPVEAAPVEAAPVEAPPVEAASIEPPPVPEPSVQAASIAEPAVEPPPVPTAPGPPSSRTQRPALYIPPLVDKPSLDSGVWRPEPLADSEHERLRKIALPKSVYAHFLLIDINSPVKEARGIPRYLPVQACCTLMGRGVGARVQLDDPQTVQPIHASIVYESLGGMEQFVLRPSPGARLRLNGADVPPDGAVCQNGDRVDIGSAKLIFFAKNVAAEV